MGIEKLGALRLLSIGGCATCCIRRSNQSQVRVVVGLEAAVDYAEEAVCGPDGGAIDKPCAFFVVAVVLAEINEVGAVNLAGDSALAGESSYSNWEKETASPAVGELSQLLGVKSFSSTSTSSFHCT